VTASWASAAPAMASTADVVIRSFFMEKFL
jgi:hypothetical protein